jgi:rubrerythrin
VSAQGERFEKTIPQKDLFRDTAEGETTHAQGHLDHLKKLGDPATGLPIGNTIRNLEAAIAGETNEYTDTYPAIARTAREEGFPEIAECSKD